MSTPTPPSDPTDPIVQATQQAFENFFEELGMGTIDPAEKEKRLMEIMEIVEARVFARVDAELTPEEAKELAACVTDEDFDKFYEQKGIDLAAITMLEAQHYREELLSDSAYIQARLDSKDAPSES